MKFKSLSIFLLLFLTACKVTDTPKDNKDGNEGSTLPYIIQKEQTECRYINGKDEILNAKAEDLEKMWKEVYKVPLDCKYLDGYGFTYMLNSESSINDALNNSEQTFLSLGKHESAVYNNDLKALFENDFIYINTLSYTVTYEKDKPLTFDINSICYKEDKVHYVNYLNQQPNTFEIKDFQNVKHIMDIFTCFDISQDAGHKFIYSEIEEENDSYTYTCYMLGRICGDWDLNDEYYISKYTGMILKDSGVVNFGMSFNDEERIIATNPNVL